MKLHLKKRYYKRSQKGREPVKYKVRQPRGVGTDIYGEIRIDPVLRKKKHSDLKRALLGHEIREIKDWGRGYAGGHTRARIHEPRLTRGMGGVSGFWKEVKRRET